MNNLEIEKTEKERLTQAHKDFAKSLVKHAYYKVHNKFLSEDLVQETFLKTWKYVLRGGEIAMMKAFLYHILNGLIIDQYRKEKHQPYSLDSLTDNGFDIPTDEHKHSGQAIDLSTAGRYIEQLPDRYKDAIHMRVMLNMSIEEIADAMGKTKNSVAVLIHRGLKKLQSMHQVRLQKTQVRQNRLNANS